MTVTRISSFSLSSITAPKIIFTSISEADATISAASFTSYKLRFIPPVIFIKTPLAPSMDVSSNGLEIAFFAASAARFSPVATPIPIRAEPRSVIIVLTSAKSKLMRPGTAIKSEIP
ncbi:hypothetical protein D3C86_1792990 [compost metagenome]